MRRILLLALCLLASLASLYAQTLPKSVLILHSYQHDLEWTRLIHNGMVMELESADNAPVLIKAEYMDTKRAWNSELAQCFADYLTQRYGQARIDLVLVSDNDAFDFMIGYGAGIFGEVPFVFAGVNDFDPASIESIRHRVTGVVEHIDYRSTINAIHMMFPEMTELKVLVDSSTTGPMTLKEFLSASPDGGNAPFVCARQGGSYLVYARHKLSHQHRRRGTGIRGMGFLHGARHRGRRADERPCPGPGRR
jgi:ABC-type uncharacterized transport system substrate-binding protein